MKLSAVAGLLIIVISSIFWFQNCSQNTAGFSTANSSLSSTASTNPVTSSVPGTVSGSIPASGTSTTVSSTGPAPFNSNGSDVTCHLNWTKNPNPASPADPYTLVPSDTGYFTFTTNLPDRTVFMVEFSGWQNILGASSAINIGGGVGITPTGSANTSVNIPANSFTANSVFARYASVTNMSGNILCSTNSLLLQVVAQASDSLPFGASSGYNMGTGDAGGGYAVGLLANNTAFNDGFNTPFQAAATVPFDNKTQLPLYSLSVGEMQKTCTPINLFISGNFAAGLTINWNGTNALFSTASSAATPISFNDTSTLTVSNSTTVTYTPPPMAAGSYSRWALLYNGGQVVGATNRQYVIIDAPVGSPTSYYSQASCP